MANLIANTDAWMDNIEALRNDVDDIQTALNEGKDVDVDCAIATALEVITDMSGLVRQLYGLTV